MKRRNGKKGRCFIVTVPTKYYKQFGADCGRKLPGVGCGVFKNACLAVDPVNTALVVMRVRDYGTREKSPDCWRSVEYLPDTQKIYEHIFLGTNLLGQEDSPACFFTLSGTSEQRHIRRHIPCNAISGEGTGKAKTTAVPIERG